MAKKRRIKKRGHKRAILGTAFFVLSAIGVYLLATMPPLLQPPSDAKEVAGIEQAVPKADYFYGRLLEGSLSNPVTGKVLADTDCKAISGHITNCIAIVQVDDGRVLRFNYQHDMSKQSCLDYGERVIVEDIQGAVRVARLL